jgi:hypothetical protein
MNSLLSNEKCNMLMSEGNVLIHHVSSRGIEVDQSKLNIVQYMPKPQKKRKFVRIFLGHVG